MRPDRVKLVRQLCAYSIVTSLRRSKSKLRVVVQHSPENPANCHIMFSIKLINAICPLALYQQSLSRLGNILSFLSDFVLRLTFQH